MTNRSLAYIVKEQRPIILSIDESVQQACRCMRESKSGSVLVVDAARRLQGIFTGRDAVRLLAQAEDPGGSVLLNAMMKDPVTVHPKDRAIDALRAMAVGGFRHVPVVDGGTIIGVVSRSDLKGMELEEFRRRQSGAPGSPASAFRSLAEILKARKALLVPEDATVQQACGAMWHSKRGASLVVDRAERLAGIFTGRDAVRVLAIAEDAAATPARQAMTRNPITLTPQGSAIDALRAMNDGGFRHLPIVEKNMILGVVSRGDFTGIEIDRLDEEEHLKEVLW
jgi:CBS domain-containing protein